MDAFAGRHALHRAQLVPVSHPNTCEMNPAWVTRSTRSPGWRAASSRSVRRQRARNSR